jgi:holo-[acyl-carrier protein] synthase
MSEPSGTLGGPHLGAAGVVVGVDLVEIAEVARSVKRFGERYLHFVFTAHELACCQSPSREATAASLAARFAAKEATIKVLQPMDARPGWRSIEVVRLPTGACKIRLSGAAARLAVERRIGPLALSMTHEAGLAAAVVISGSGLVPGATSVDDRAKS